MKIEVKSLKVAGYLSQETTAYSAIIYVDGAKAFHASNDGHGGCDLFYPVNGYTGPTERQINDWLKAQGQKVDMSAYGMDPLDMTLEHLVGDLIEAQQRRKRLDRMVKAKIVLIGKHKGVDALFTMKIAPTPVNIAAIAKRNPDTPVVNGNADLYDRALALV